MVVLRAFDPILAAASGTDMAMPAVRRTRTMWKMRRVQSGHRWRCSKPMQAVTLIKAYPGEIPKLPPVLSWHRMPCWQVAVHIKS